MLDELIHLFPQCEFEWWGDELHLWGGGIDCTIKEDPKSFDLLIQSLDDAKPLSFSTLSSDLSFADMARKIRIGFGVARVSDLHEVVYDYAVQHSRLIKVADALEALRGSRNPNWNGVYYTLVAAYSDALQLLLVRQSRLLASDKRELVLAHTRLIHKYSAILAELVMEVKA